MKELSVLNVLQDFFLTLCFHMFAFQAGYSSAVFFYSFCVFL